MWAMGTHTLLLGIPVSGQLSKAKNKIIAVVKDEWDNCMGVDFAKTGIRNVDKSLEVDVLRNDGEAVKFRDIVFYVKAGRFASIFKGGEIGLKRYCKE